ncbi:MAG: DUF2577 family protein [Lachnospiraceae bacterium]|nr:DUF2577 family protein [Lachnospiraceae bacterium]
MDAVRASKPTTGIEAEIISLEPLKIKVDQKLTLTKEFLIITNEMNLKLKKGKVLLLQLQGGQRYVVLGTL